MADRESPDRNLAMELVRVTEAAAMAAARWMGRGDKEGADGAAVDAMRTRARHRADGRRGRHRRGREGRSADALQRRAVGDGTPIRCDIAVDPIDGTTLTALGRGNAWRRARRQRPRHHVQSRALRLHGEDRRRSRLRKGVIDIDAPIATNLAAVAEGQGRAVRDLTAVILDRDRHDRHDRRGARGRRPHPPHPRRRRRRRHLHGWPTPAPTSSSASAAPPRASSAAAALKCMGGEMQGRLWPRNDAERRAAIDEGYDLDQVLTTEDLVRRQLLLRRHRHHRRRAAAWASTTARFVQHAVARHALEVGHRPADQRPSRARQGAPAPKSVWWAATSPTPNRSTLRSPTPPTPPARCR
jgi:fructose-1,6-bisphosphatase II